MTQSAAPRSCWSRLPRALGREALVAVFFLGLAAIATRPLLWRLGTHTLTGPDPLVDLWTVDWLSDHLLRLSFGELFHGNVYHPARHAVLFSDLSMGTAVLLVPFRLLTRDPLVLYNVGLLLALTFAGWAFHALTRELTGSRTAGILTGILAAFGSHQMLHIHHLNLLTTGWLALLLLGLHRMVRSPSPGLVLLAGLSFSLAAQSSGYYAVAATLLSLVFAATHLRSLRDLRVAAAWASAALIGALLTAPYILGFLSVRAEQGLDKPLEMSVQDAFRPSRDLSSRSYLDGALLGSGGEQLFPGLLTLVLAGVAVLRRRPGVRFFGAASLALLVVSLGPRLELGETALTLPYRWIYSIPPLDCLQHPYTFAAVAGFCLSVLAGLGYAGLLVARRRWAAPAVILAAMAETLGPPPKLRPLPPGVPAAYRLLQRLPPGPVLEIPFTSDGVMLWAARHRRPVLNGAGSFAPADSLLLERYIVSRWLARVPKNIDATKATRFLLDRFPVRYLIVPAGRKPELARLIPCFERSAIFVFVVEADDGDRVYEIRRQMRLPRGAGEGWEDGGVSAGRGLTPGAQPPPGISRFPRSSPHPARLPWALTVKQPQFSTSSWRGNGSAHSPGDDPGIIPLSPPARQTITSRLRGRSTEKRGCRAASSPQPRYRSRGSRRWLSSNARPPLLSTCSGCGRRRPRSGWQRTWPARGRETVPSRA